jgi:serine/threonine protein kinase
MEGMLLRHLGALRRAIHSLEAYYSKEIGLPSLTRIPTHPYPTSFTSGDNSEEKHFKYLSKLKGRNLFFGEMHGDGGAAICIKFVPRYCKEAHELLAENGFAPKLHAVERLPGGLFMVVMDDVSEDYESLFNFVQEHPDSLVAEKGGARNLLSEKIRHRVLELHRAGFVHGDIRDTNIMIKKSGFNDGSFMMVDYDSSGVIKQVRYPLDLNTTTVKRPQGATGGAIVEVEHDLEMLDTIWDP